MRMSWSKLWQRGGRKQESGNEKRGAPAAASGPEAVTLAWLAADGVARCEGATVHSHTHDQIGVQLSQAIEPDTPVWLISDGFERAGVVLACNVQQDHLIGHITLREETLAKVSAEGPASCLHWIEHRGGATSCIVSLAGAGEGRVSASLPRNIPSSTMVRIVGREYQCLGASTSCERQGQRWIANIDVISHTFKTRPH